MLLLLRLSCCFPRYWHNVFVSESAFVYVHHCNMCKVELGRYSPRDDPEWVELKEKEQINKGYEEEDKKKAND